MTKRRNQRWSRAGYTVIELMVYLTIGVIVIGAIYQVLIGQSRLYSKEREIMDVRTSLRAGAELLAVELRMAAPGDGDIYQVAAESVTVRSIQGSGVVCETKQNGRLLGLHATSGTFDNEVGDSVLVYTGGGSSGWVITKVLAVNEGPLVLLPTCAWNSVPPEYILAVDTLDGTLLNGLQVGAELRAFRKTQYTTAEIEGRWWLVRETGAGVDAELLTGPLAAPADSGLVFRYYEANGDTTSVIGEIRLIEILLKGESLKGVRRRKSDPTPQVDTLRTYVAVRG